MKKDFNYLKFFKNHSEAEAKQIKKITAIASIAYSVVILMLGICIALVMI